MKRIKFFVMSAAFFMAAQAFASDDMFTPDSFSVEGGSTINGSGTGANTAMGRVGVQWDWDQNWFAKSSPISIDGYWDFSVGQWHSNGNPKDHDITDIGFTPVFRFQPSSHSTDFIPYAEVGVGAHYLTSKNISDNRRFSTHYQFGDHVAAGFRFGKGGEFDISYRLQHLSNAGIDSPNPGINFHQLRLQYHF